MNITPTILLVDDEERFVKSLHEILKHYNYDCTEALTGGEAIKLLDEGHFDLALLDVNLPDISGCEILEYINKTHKHTTSIMLTGISTVETAVAAMKHGAYDFLNKPINHGLLLKTIDKALEHNQLNEKLSVSEAKFRTLADASWEGLLIHENGRFIDANEKFFSMFGYQENELRNCRFLEKLCTPESYRIVQERIDKGLLGTYEATGVTKEGRQFLAEINSRSMSYNGRNVRMCAIRDLSERIKAEAERFELHKKLERANKLKALGLMAGAVAHDLNNILTGVVSYPELLLAQMQPSDKYYPHIKKIQQTGRRAAAIVSELVTFARGHSQVKTAHNINTIVTDHLDSIEHNGRLARYPRVEVQVSLQKDIHNTCCSPEQINKILLNLIGNALEAVREDGLITITTQNCKFVNPLTLDVTPGCAEDYVKITVADNGPGIPQKDVGHIFEPFYTTKIMGKSGTGLGLSIVWNTVQAHNGWIEVKNTHPGVAFEVYLPATMDEICAVKQEPDLLTLRGKGEKILLIDDQMEQNEIISGMLQRLDYKTLATLSGEEGLKVLEAEPVDLVLLDMIMGEGLNGYQTYEKILQIRPGQKAIVISGYSKTEDYLKAKNLGVSHFLEKPVSMKELGTAIRRTLYPD